MPPPGRDLHLGDGGEDARTIGERNRRFDRGDTQGPGDDAKEIVLYLADEATFEEWKEAYGTSLRGCHRGDPACLARPCWPTSTATSSASTPLWPVLHQMVAINSLHRRSDARWSHSGGGIQRLKSEKNVVCIKGNHERWALERRHVGGRRAQFSSSPVISPTMSVGASTFRARPCLCWPALPGHLGRRAGGRSRGDVARARTGQRRGWRGEGNPRPETAEPAAGSSSHARS